MKVSEIKGKIGEEQEEPVRSEETGHRNKLRGTGGWFGKRLE